MVFKSPSWVPSLPCAIPDTSTVGDFVLSGDHSNRPKDSKTSPLICAISGKEYSLEEVGNQVDLVARSLSKELGWLPNKGEPSDKVLGILSFNSVRYSDSNFACLCETFYLF